MGTAWPGCERCSTLVAQLPPPPDSRLTPPTWQLSLQRLVRTINNRGFPPPEPAAADGAGPSQPAPQGPLQAHAATLSMPAMANTPGSELIGRVLGLGRLGEPQERSVAGKQCG